MRSFGKIIALALAVNLPLAACARAADKPAPAAANIEAKRDEIGRRMLATPGFTLPANHAELSASLAKDDARPAMAAYRSVASWDDLSRLANWSRYHVVRGEGGHGLAFLYAVVLADMARSAAASANGAAIAPDLKQVAASQFLYALALAQVDGARCTDATAPQQKRDGIWAARAPFAEAINGMDRSKRLEAVNGALMLERDTAELRAPDAQLCSGGLADLGAGLAAGGATSAQAQPGQPGKTFDIQGPPGQTDRFLPADQQAAAMDKARQALLVQMPGMVGLDRTPSAYPAAATPPGS